MWMLCGCRWWEMKRAPKGAHITHSIPLSVTCRTSLSTCLLTYMGIDGPAYHLINVLLIIVLLIIGKMVQNKITLSHSNLEFPGSWLQRRRARSCQLTWTQRCSRFCPPHCTLGCRWSNKDCWNPLHVISLDTINCFGNNTNHEM